MPTLSRDHIPLYVIGLGHALTHWFPSSFFLILPILAVQADLSYTQVGVLITMRGVTSAVVNLPGGALVDIVGRRGLIMALSLVWCGFPYFVLGLSTNYAVVLAASALMGIGNNAWHPAAISDLSERYPNNRGYALSIHALGANLGELLGPLVTGILVAVFFYAHVMMANLIPTLVLAALFFLWARGDASRRTTVSERLSTKAYWQGAKQLARNLGMILLSIVGGLRTMTQQGLSTFIPFYLMGLGMGPALVGVYLAVVQLAGLIASPISGILSDRIGRKPVVSGGMLATTVVVVLFANVSAIQIPGIDFTWIFVGVLSLLGFFLYALRPALQAWTMDLVPKEMGGSTVGVMFGVQALFSSIAPAVGGVLADSYGLLATFYFLAGTIVVANIIVMLIPDRLLVSAAEREGALARSAEPGRA
ncbi:MAG: MFS transporter [Chloroflexi bacterium]|nr:MFS transporter [Chloroflexota bacterium]